jgi:Protein of unknown function (DUF4238)
MNEPRRHHYIPQFYLRRWCSQDGRLAYYAWEKSRASPKTDLVCRRVDPRDIAAEKNLYALARTADKQAFEKYVNGEVDDAGARALQEIVAGRVEELTSEDRAAWARFFVALPVRNPEAVADIKQSSSSNLLKRVRATMAETEDFEKLWDGVLKNDEEIAFLHENYGLFVIEELCLNPQYHEIFTKMHWWTMDLSSSDYALLTSDRPYCNFRPASHPQTLIYVPVSPSLAFFASPDPAKPAQLERYCARKGVKHMATMLNTRVVSWAWKYVYATDDTQSRFVKNRLYRQM